MDAALYKLAKAGATLSVPEFKKLPARWGREFSLVLEFRVVQYAAAEEDCEEGYEGVDAGEGEEPDGGRGVIYAQHHGGDYAGGADEYLHEEIEHKNQRLHIHPSEHPLTDQVAGQHQIRIAEVRKAGRGGRGGVERHDEPQRHEGQHGHQRKGTHALAYAPEQLFERRLRHEVDVGLEHLAREAAHRGREHLQIHRKRQRRDYALAAHEEAEAYRGYDEDEVGAAEDEGARAAVLHAVLVPEHRRALASAEAPYGPA